MSQTNNELPTEVRERRVVAVLRNFMGAVAGMLLCVGWEETLRQIFKEAARGGRAANLSREDFLARAASAWDGEE